MIIEVTPTTLEEGAVGFTARVPGTAETYMTAIFRREIGELYVSSYAVERALQGSRLSGKLFYATIQAAADHGDVRAICGIPSGPNLEVLTDDKGKLVEENIIQTPWAKVLAELGYETVLRNGLMESRRKDAT